MNIFEKIRAKFLDATAPKITEYHSKISGDLILREGLGYKYIASGSTITQSGELVRDIWANVLAHVATTGGNWLMLGVAGGSAAHYISQKYSPKKITGVEIDPVMIEIGKKHFGLDKIKNFKIIEADANKFVYETKEVYDYVLVDIYCGDMLPDFVYSKKFLQQLKHIGKQVIINHLFYGSKKPLAENLIKQLEQVYTNIKFYRKYSNILIACS